MIDKQKEVEELNNSLNATTKERKKMDEEQQTSENIEENDKKNERCQTDEEISIENDDKLSNSSIKSESMIENQHTSPAYWWGQIPDTRNDILPHPTEITEFEKKVIVQVSAKAQNALFLSDTGDVYMCGEGFTDERSYPKPQLLNSFILEKALKGIRINYVCCGVSHALALSEDGKVYSWGNSINGELGHGNNNNSNNPKIVKGLLNHTIRRIGCGAEFSIAITDRGYVYSWGNGKYGVLGHGNELNKNIPCEISDFHVLLPCMISCGWSFTVLVDGSGNVYTWGRGSEGQCGNGDLNNNLRPKYIDLLYSKESSQNIIGVACGYFHCLALNGEGVVYSWGLGNNGQLGLDFLSDLEYNSSEFYHPLPTRIKLEKEIKMISAGSFHSLFVSKENEIYVCGKNDNKQLIYNDDDDIIWTPEKMELSNKLKEELNNVSYINNISSGLSFNIIIKMNSLIKNDSNIQKIKSGTILSDNINSSMLRLPSLRQITNQYLLYREIPLKIKPKYKTNKLFNKKSNENEIEGEELNKSIENEYKDENLKEIEVDYNEWKEIMEYWSIKKNDKKVKELFQKGIPLQYII